MLQLADAGDWDEEVGERPRRDVAADNASIALGANHEVGPADAAR